MRAVHKELVTTQTTDGVRLDGALQVPAEPTGKLGIDLFICHHGVGGNFYGASFFEDIGAQAAEAGVATLRVNNRGHDQAYISASRRLGAAYELLDDCRHDFLAWLDFAEARGYRRIAVWGHSLGAV
jgi:predicted alpha/beta hydrolase